jgi:hypothetical protein
MIARQTPPSAGSVVLKRMTSEKNIREKTESSGFERGYNALGFVGPVIQDLGYGFALDEIYLVEGYRKSDFYLVGEGRYL